MGICAAPAAPKTISIGGGRGPPPSGMVFWAAEAAQTQKIYDFRPAQKACIKNPKWIKGSSDPQGPLLILERDSEPAGSDRTHKDQTCPRTPNSVSCLNYRCLRNKRPSKTYDTGVAMAPKKHIKECHIHEFPWDPGSSKKSAQIHRNYPVEGGPAAGNRR